jgi:hypothetical protein
MAFSSLLKLPGSQEKCNYGKSGFAAAQWFLRAIAASDARF